MARGLIFTINFTQVVRLTAETRFPDNVKDVDVRVVGRDRILSPVENTWDSFFLSKEAVSDDFMVERLDQTE